jgi:peptide/nickel transport system permease protein
MRGYILRRLIYTLLLIFLTSVLSFFIITLPPGDYVTRYVERLALEGGQASMEEMEEMRALYGLDKPIYEQYALWMGRLMQGDMGRSFAYNRPVTDLISERLPATMALSIATLILTFMIAIPIGIYLGCQAVLRWRLCRYDHWVHWRIHP